MGLPRCWDPSSITTPCKLGKGGSWPATDTKDRCLRPRLLKVVQLCNIKNDISTIWAILSPTTMFNMNDISQRKKERDLKQICANWTCLSIGSELARSTSKSIILIRSSKLSTKLGKTNWKRIRKRKKQKVSMLMEIKTILPKLADSSRKPSSSSSSSLVNCLSMILMNTRVSVKVIEPASSTPWVASMIDSNWKTRIFSRSWSRTTCSREQGVSRKRRLLGANQNSSNRKSSPMNARRKQKLHLLSTQSRTSIWIQNIKKKYSKYHLIRILQLKMQSFLNHKWSNNNSMPGFILN